MPKWRALRKRHDKDGLKLVVISARTNSGRCADPGWDPDQVICDDKDGTLAKRFGVDQAPATFLWSWQGDLLVEKGQVSDASAKMRTWLKSTPQMEVEVTGLAPAAGLSARGLRGLLQHHIKKDDRFALVTSEKARAKLAELKAKTFEAGFGEAPQCEAGSGLSASSLLQAATVSKDDAQRLEVTMRSIDNGCTLATTSVSLDKAKPGEAVAEALSLLNRKIKQEAQLPQSAQPKSAVVSSGAAPEPKRFGLTTIPEVGEFTAKIPKTDLRNVDLAYLKLLQKAQRSDKDSKLTDQQKAAAWDKVVQYDGLNPLQLEAESRRDEWLGMADAKKQRIRDIKRIDKEEREDREKLKAIMAMDNSVISPEQKRAYQDEFDRTYAPWRDALAEWRGGRTAEALRNDRLARASTKEPAPKPQQKLEVVRHGMNNLDRGGLFAEMESHEKGKPRDEIADLESMLRMKPKSQAPKAGVDISQNHRRKTLRFSVGKKSIRYPGYLVSGIAFDDRGHLRAADWSQGVGPKRIYELRASDGKLVGSIPAPSDWTGGLAFAQGYLWAAANSKLHRINPRNGRVTKRIKLWSEQAYGRGLGFDGRYFWFADQNDRSKKRKKPGEIELVHPAHGRTVQVLKAPSRNGGMTFDGKNVWFVSGEQAELHKIDPKTGKSIETYRIHGVPAGAFAHDLAWDGHSLWISMAKTRQGRRGFNNWIMRIDVAQVDEVSL